MFLDPSERLLEVLYAHSLHTAGCLKACVLKRWHLATHPNVPNIYFRVRFYVPVNYLRERVTRHVYYQQLRANVLTYNLFCAHDTYVQFAALALQAEVGDLSMAVHRCGSKRPYFNINAYFPEKLIQTCSATYLVNLVCIHHRALKAMVRYVAEFEFIRLASKSNSNFNFHLYKLEKLTQPYFSVWLGISPFGFQIYRQSRDSWITVTHHIKWNAVNRLSYHGRKLAIFTCPPCRTKFEFAMMRSLTAKHLFALATHMHFFQSTAELWAIHPPDDLLNTVDCGKIEERAL